ncbi:MAG: bifunctional riboflavin kinase/FAD synthetase [Desulfuromonadaceae bacterium]|nr:bifunctional riboflavin kinase/FAD synthetase [Desulfuromonadaceae bacterium]
MNIIRSLEQIEQPFSRAVVTLGNFDGVHLGHREIFRRVVRSARQRGGTSVVCTFNPHPLKMLAPQQAPRLINTAEEKERLIAASAVDVMLQIPFTPELASLTPEQFVDDILLKTIGVEHLIVGYDYAFGKGRAGSVGFLQRQGHEKGFTVDVFGPVQFQGQVLSSTRVRQTILRGDVAGAVDLLGRHFNLEGRVVHGDNRGHQLGFATANLETDKELLPPAGVYAAKVRHGDNEFDAVVNLGQKPTFGEHAFSIEVHLLDFSGDLYDQTLRLYFVDRLREEKRFPSAQALISAIRQDVATARQKLATTRIIEFREYLAVDQNGETPACR